MARAIGLGMLIVVTYAVVMKAGLRRDWVEYMVLATTVAGIGTVVGRTHVDPPFLKAAMISFTTFLCIQSLVYAEMSAGPTSAQPAVLASPEMMLLAIVPSSLMVGAMGGVVALGVRTLQVRAR